MVNGGYQMTDQLKPKILISKCIEHEACRYDGSMISSSFVKRIKDYVNFETVCPEVTIGLTVPRESIRMVYDESTGQKRLLSYINGLDYTKPMHDFAHDYSEAIKDRGIHGVILKSRSPSCGIKEVKLYPGIGKVPALTVKSEGFFGGAVLEHNPNLPVEDEGRLLNYDIREHFLTRIYTLARFENVKKSESMGELVKFHSEHKYLLMAYHQAKQKELGVIVANPTKEKTNVVIDTYENHLKSALSKPLKKGRNTNMILHMFGYVSEYLSPSEKAFFLDQLSLYNEAKKPFSVIMTVLYGWAIRFDSAYLKNQKIFEPYPIEILDVMDSGKGIE